MLRGLLEFSPASALMVQLALGLALASSVLLFVRRRAIPSATMGCFVAAVTLLVLAAAGPSLRLPTTRQVTVMVDVSPSTRTAQYRTMLPARLRQLLGNTPYRLYFFADSAKIQTSPPNTIPDQLVERTIFAPPAGSEAILLFSDAQFDLPPGACPPVFVAVDAAMQSPPDAMVADLKVVDGGSDASTVRSAVVRIANHGERRMAYIQSGILDRMAVPSGNQILTQKLKSGTTATSVRLSADDAWPENDALSIELPPPQRLSRWWVSTGAAPEGFQTMRPEALPSESQRFLEPAVIVLDNVAAGWLSPVQQQRLQQYVRDLGGTLVMLGGERAYAAGGYVGTILDDIAPLASAPPTPTIHWMLLGDASGSMSAAVDSTTRFALANDALLKVLAALPLEDAVSIGSFSDELSWWSRGRGTRQTLAMPLPPGDIGPRGPTNLQSALNAVIAEAGGGGPGAERMPSNLLLLTDAEAKIEDAEGIAKSMNARNVHLHLLVIAPEGTDKTALPALSRIAMATGGSVLSEADPRKWTAAARELLRAASPPHLMQDAVEVKSRSTLPLDAGGVKPWNRTWVKNGASMLAETVPGDGAITSPVPMAARWMLGNGMVVATAFATPTDMGAALALKTARPPRDPRFSVVWLDPARPRVVVDAIEDGRFLNDLPLVLQLAAQSGSAGDQSLPIGQTAPGRYELSIEAPRNPTFATVTLGQTVMDRTALPTRYAAEYEHIGNNLPAMAELARRTDGAIVPPTQNTPVNFRFPPSTIPLLPWIAAAVAALVAAGLVFWRRNPGE